MSAKCAAALAVVLASSFAAMAEVIVPPTIYTKNAIVVCFDGVCFGNPSSVILPPVGQPMAHPGPPPAGSCVGGPGPKLPGERILPLTIRINRDTPTEISAFLVGTGLTLLGADASGLVKRTVSGNTPGAMELMISRSSPMAIGTLYALYENNVVLSCDVSAPVVPQYLIETLSAPGLSVGAAGTFGSFVLDGSLPPTFFRTQEVCYWAGGGGRCDTNVLCELEAVTTPPRFRLRPNPNISNVTAFIRMLFAVDENLPALGREEAYGPWGQGVAENQLQNVE